MSLKTFIASITGAIKKFWTRVKPDVKKAIDAGVVVVENLKNFTEGPIGNIVEVIVPDNILDPVRLQALRVALPKILLEMKLVQAGVNAEDANAIILSAVETLRQIGGDWLSEGAKKNFYDSIAVLVAQVAADGKLDWDDAKLITKWYYDHKFSV